MSGEFFRTLDARRSRWCESRVAKWEARVLLHEGLLVKADRRASERRSSLTARLHRDRREPVEGVLTLAVVLMSSSCGVFGVIGLLRERYPRVSGSLAVLGLTITVAATVETVKCRRIPRTSHVLARSVMWVMVVLVPMQHLRRWTSEVARRLLRMSAQVVLFFGGLYLSFGAIMLTLASAWLISLQARGTHTDEAAFVECSKNATFPWSVNCQNQFILHYASVVELLWLVVGVALFTIGVGLVRSTWTTWRAALRAGIPIVGAGLVGLVTCLQTLRSLAPNTQLTFRQLVISYAVGATALLLSWHAYDSGRPEPTPSPDADSDEVSGTTASDPVETTPSPLEENSSAKTQWPVPDGSRDTRRIRT
jgi:hypothetical protein